MRGVTALAVGLLLVVGLRADEQELAKLKGTWVVVEAQRGGAPYEEAKGDKLTFDGDKIVVVEGKEPRTGKVKIDASRSPKQMDLIPDEEANRPIPAVYELSGDTLKIALSRQERPTELATKEGDRNILLTLKREKGKE